MNLVTTTSDLLLGSFELRAVSSGLTLIDGGIIELVRYDSNLDSPTQLQRIFDNGNPIPISAGRGYVDVTTGRRRLTGVPPAAALSVPMRQRRERRVSRQLSNGCTSGTYGDITGGTSPYDMDGVFTVMDALRAKQIVAGLYDPSYFCQWAQQQFDPDLSGDMPKPNLLDARYLMLVAAKKLRFLVEYNLADQDVSVGSNSDLVVTVRLFNEQSQPAIAQTNVRMEFSLDYADTAVYSQGEDANVTAAANHWVAKANHTGDGYYQVAVRPADGWAAGSIGVSVSGRRSTRRARARRRAWPFSVAPCLSTSRRVFFQIVA